MRLCAQASEEIDEDEYDSMREDTLNQLREFQGTLRKFMAGNMTLVDELSAMQLAIQAAVSQAFQTPEVIEMFAKKQPEALRHRLGELDTAQRLNKMTAVAFRNQKLEILSALKSLGDRLSAEEESFLATNMNETMAQFQSSANSLGDAAHAEVIAIAGSDISRAGK